MKKTFIFALATAIIFGLFDAVSAMGAGPKKPAAERVVPNAADFTLKDLNGKDMTLSSFKGKKVLLVFGTTWCPYCVAEIPDLNAFYTKHQDKDVKLLGININESMAKVSIFAKKQNIKYTVLVDANGEVAKKYGIYGIPAVFLVDQNGIITYNGSGAPEGGFEQLLK